MNPSFAVPAEYFYALGAAMPMEATPEDRYQMAILQKEQLVKKQLEKAIKAGVIHEITEVNKEQATRRLGSLGLTQGINAECQLDDTPAALNTLIQDWLNFAGEDINSFWAEAISSHAVAHLSLVLCAVTENHTPLIEAIKSWPAPGGPINSAQDLANKTAKEWEAFFQSSSGWPNNNLLPPFTQPGSPEERVVAFIRHLRKFFDVQATTDTPSDPTIDAPPLLGSTGDALFTKFTKNYKTLNSSDFVFGTWDEQKVQAAVEAVFNIDFPGDPSAPSAKAWLEQILRVINDLYVLTDIGQADLHFSLMEALYARGFTSKQDIQALTFKDFQSALTGTIAFDPAPAIYKKVKENEQPDRAGQPQFKPINPDGHLTNCIPPLHLSPLGPVAYFSELLKVSPESTCEAPLPIADVEITLAGKMANRRGSLGELHATRTNLETSLPLIDIVNECLEAIAAKASTGGVVHDTAADELSDHKLRANGTDPDKHQLPYHHDPATLFAVLPQYSSPATPVSFPDAYTNLKGDFSAPVLPYSQPLDISRSYLHQLHTSRYAVMRRFRKDITEFVLSPNADPAEVTTPTGAAGFQHHLWRYPVKIEIAREYLSITPEEYDRIFTQNIAIKAPANGQLLLWELYGFDSKRVGTQKRLWIDIVEQVPEFLKRTDLTYCEFLELWRSEFVKFSRAGKGENAKFLECEPCYLDKQRIRFEQPQEPNEALKRLVVFIRLWHKLQHVEGAKYSFAHLRDICDVLQLFTADGSINPDFVRQLAAFQMLRDHLRLKLADASDTQPNTTGADRTHLLALWVGESASKWSWAVEHLLDQIQHYARARHHCGCRGREFIKVLAENLDPLSRLAGFDPTLATDTWHTHPTHTLRFAEVLAKIYASEFGVGEILFLFTTEDHLDGDDPFPLQEVNEALDCPFDLPDDEDEHSLWVLRHKLLKICVSEHEVFRWTWERIEASLREEFGYTPPANGSDFLLSLGEHFFPSILEACGCLVDIRKRQYRVDLPGTPPLMWNTPLEGPFRYDVSASQLWTQLPLRDKAVIAKLSRIRQLNLSEQQAVRELYFLPRLELAPFAFIFSNFAEADERLIQEPDEMKRWAYFQREFALCHARCQVIAEHLACHVTAATEQPNSEGNGLAWRLLQYLFADENKAKTPWEVDSGQVPDVTWKPQPNGGAFAALLGLTGTGLLSEFTVEAGKIIWRENQGPMSAFSHDKNYWNSPLPTVLPSMGLTLTHDQERFVAVRNGYALKDDDGKTLGGIQGFGVRWQGVLLVEQAGWYEFHAGAPTPDGEKPDFEAAEHHRWRIMLKRGQKSFILLSHNWPNEQASARCSTPLPLKQGAYQLIVEFVQPQPTFANAEDVCPQHTGFQVKYSGPDSCDRLISIPLNKLFCDFKDQTLADKIALDDNEGDRSPSYKLFLEQRFISTVRDIRRTYQRAFKALLFAHRFGLSAKPISDDGQSEIGYMLTHANNFAGRSYYRTGTGFGTHLADFNFNLLPLKDNYRPPAPAQDSRVQPSVKRQQALFDWWERIFDYTLMRQESRPARERPVWFLFHEAAENHPDNPAHLLRHLGVDLNHTSLVLTYYQTQNLNVYSVSTDDLEDERWSVRAWQAEKWIRQLIQHFFCKDIRDARPDLWASDDPSARVSTEPKTGNENLTKFVCDGCFENGAPRRYEDVKRLNDTLRQHARNTLLAYLCTMNRVPLPWGGFAQAPKDLSDLLLLDVEIGICERASRIEEAISALQLYVQRCRLNLESDFVISLAFALLWDHHFATFRVWEVCKRREIYRENWIDWDELQQAQRTETFRFLEAELRQATLTVPVPGGLDYWPSQPLPVHSGLTLLQQSDPDLMKRLAPSPEGLNLLSTPEEQARPSWLSTVSRSSSIRNSDGVPVPNDRVQSTDLNPLPLWMQAAMQIGVQFVRVAAANEPPASTGCNAQKPQYSGYCVECDQPHPATVDEYYFWLSDSRYYNPPKQDPDLIPKKPDKGNEGGGNGRGIRSIRTGSQQQQNSESAWHKDDQLPKLLYWESEPMVHLAWCRIHNGEFQQPRRSDEGVRLPKGKIPELKFLGRKDDSLNFQVIGGIVPPGFTHPPEPGFRYDLATDTAAILPLIVTAQSNTKQPGGLLAYPYFAYFEPGARLIPPSLFSPVLAIARSLRTHCRFEATLKWYELFFNPLREDCTWCPVPDRDGSRNNEGEEISCCQSIGLSVIALQKRSVTLHYLETLWQWVDALIQRNSPEAFQQARLICDTGMRILGTQPHTIFEEDTQQPPQKLADFIPHLAPLNPRLLGLYEHVSDRLTLIHTCLNGRRLHKGQTNQGMPYWGNSSTRSGWQTTVEPCLDEAAQCCPSSPYRFLFLIQKAQELANEVRGMGAALLAAFEKGDAEYLTAMRTTHERQLLNLTLEVRQNQWREADWQVQALQKTKESTQARRQYYDTLIRNGLNSGEQQYEASNEVSLTSRYAANVSETVGQSIASTPDTWYGAAGIAGTPLFFQQLPIGTKLAGVFSTVARISNILAEIANTNASLSLTQAGWSRRQEEWRHQVEVLDIEIEQIGRQLLGAERRRDIALRELNNHQQQMEHAAEVHDFLRDKFTNHELYLWLQQETAALHYRMYELALQYALHAQQKFNYERGYLARKFLPDAIWDNLHEGLLAGERLQLSLRQMENTYLCENVREYELTKHFSLRLHFPLAFLQLKVTGYCEIDIPEWMFDLDYPGHYMRRIKNVTLTIPCVVGPYTGVHCRLILLSSTTRVDPRLSEPPAICCDNGRSGKGYQLLPDDPRAVKQYAATEAIATSSGQNDSGLFELSFRDERYLPFEFAGAISRWRIELPQENNQFDMDTLSDVVLHLNYMAREGGEILRRAASEIAQQHLPDAGWRFFDVKHEFPDAWHRFQNCSVHEKSSRQLALRLGRNMFAFLSGHRDLLITRLELFFEAPGAEPSTHQVVKFLPGHRLGHEHEEECECEVLDMTCIASANWPGLYHGVLDIQSELICHNGEHYLGTFKFPPCPSVFSRAFLFCCYDIK